MVYGPGLGDPCPVGWHAVPRPAPFTDDVAVPAASRAHQHAPGARTCLRSTTQSSASCLELPLTLNLASFNFCMLASDSLAAA